MRNYLTTIKNGCNKLGYDYNLIETTSTYDIALMNFLRNEAE